MTSLSDDFARADAVGRDAHDQLVLDEHYRRDANTVKEELPDWIWLYGNRDRAAKTCHHLVATSPFHTYEMKADRTDKNESGSYCLYRCSVCGRERQSVIRNLF